jgi:parallel beta-helix repeat protein
LGNDTNDVTVSDTEIYETTSNGFFVWNAGSNLTLVDSYVHDTNQENNPDAAAYADAGWGQAVTLWNASTSQILDNTVENNWGEGIDMIGSGGGHRVAGNILHNDYSVGIYIDHSQNNVVEGNYVTNDQITPFNRADIRVNEGIAIADETGTAATGSTNNIIRNNVTAYVSEGFRYGAYGLGLGLQNTQIINNTFAGFVVAGIQIDDGASSPGNLVANNIVVSNVSGAQAAGAPSSVMFSHNLWSGTTTGIITGAGDVLASPGFAAACVDAPSCFELLPGSAAKGKGEPLANDTVDFAGTPRGNPPSIGAYE